MPGEFCIPFELRPCSKIRIQRVVNRRYDNVQSIPFVCTILAGRSIIKQLQSNYKALPMLFRSTKTEVHTDGIATKKQPKVVITDELGWVYEPDASTGVLTRTKGKVSIENTDEPVKPQSDRERTCALHR